MKLTDTIRINGQLMSIKTLADKMQSAASEMAANKSNGCYYWWIGNQIGKNRIAICIGWAPGYEPDENDAYSDGEYHLSAKLAFQSINNIMQCDYDVDWLMPYDPDTGEVDDTSTSLYENTDYLDLAQIFVERYCDYNDILNRHDPYVQRTRRCLFE